MLWVSIGKATHQIISYNLHYNEESSMHELWVTRPNGKNLLIAESKESKFVEEVKEALDFALEEGEPIIVL